MEFYLVPGLGNNENQIQALDVAGVALKAVQELEAVVSLQNELIEELKAEIAALKAE
jgi:hypothetical protein